MPIHHITALHGKIEAGLKTALAKSNGRAIMLVHPFFDKDGLNSQYGARLSRLFKAIREEKTKTPVILLEETAKLHKTRALLKATFGPVHKNSVVMVPTDRASPNPMFGFPELFNSQDANERGEAEADAWNQFTSRLKELGVTSILLGGSYTHLHPSREVADYESMWRRRRIGEYEVVSSGCAGTTYKRLIESGKFPTVRLMPGISYPPFPKKNVK